MLKARSKVIMQVDLHGLWTTSPFVQLNIDNSLRPYGCRLDYIVAFQSCTLAPSPNNGRLCKQPTLRLVFALTVKCRRLVLSRPRGPSR